MECPDGSIDKPEGTPCAEKTCEPADFTASSTCCQPKETCGAGMQRLEAFCSKNKMPTDTPCKEAECTAKDFEGAESTCCHDRQMCVQGTDIQPYFKCKGDSADKPEGTPCAEKTCKAADFNTNEGSSTCCQKEETCGAGKDRGYTCDEDSVVEESKSCTDMECNAADFENKDAACCQVKETCEAGKTRLKNDKDRNGFEDRCSDSYVMSDDAGATSPEYCAARLCTNEDFSGTGAACCEPESCEEGKHRLLKENTEWKPPKRRGICRDNFVLVENQYDVPCAAKKCTISDFQGDAAPCCEEDPGSCQNSDGDVVDKYGYGCAYYSPKSDENVGDCGQYDTEKFNSNEMCCGCGGGDRTNTADSKPLGQLRPTQREAQILAQKSQDSLLQQTGKV
jgi:hypothetical protein